MTNFVTKEGKTGKMFLPELPGVPRERGDDAVEALQADRVRAVQQLWSVLAAIVHAWSKRCIGYRWRKWIRMRKMERK